MTTTCAVYARKSDKDAVSVEEQIEECKDFIARKEWIVGPIFSDNNKRGKFHDRPGLNALMAEVTRTPKAFTALVVMNDDRLSRGYIEESLALQRKILASGVELWCYQDGRQIKLDDVTDETMAAIRAGQARAYSVEVSKKTTNKLRQKAEKGYAVGGAAFGYRLVPQGVGLGTHGADKHTHVIREIDEVQADVVRRIFELAASGRGYRMIANELNREHALAPSSRGWTKDQIARVVANPIYIGRSTWGTTQVEVPELRIISDDLWARTQARREQTRQSYLTNERGQLISKPETGLASKYALSGVGRCWSCGAGLKAYPATAKDVARYRCGARARRGATVCQNTAGIRVDELDQAVREAIHQTLTQDPQILADILAERDARDQVEQQSRGDVRALALAKAAKLEQENKAAVEAIVSGEIKGDLLAAVQQTHDERKAEILRLRATPAPPPRFDRAAFTAAHLQFFGAAKYGMMTLRSPEQTRAAMKKLGIDRLTPRPDGKGGWTFESQADLAGVLTGVAVEERVG